MMRVNNGERLPVKFGAYEGEAGVITNHMGVTKVAFASSRVGPNGYSGEGEIDGEPWRIVFAERGVKPFVVLTVEPITLP